VVGFQDCLSSRYVRTSGTKLSFAMLIAGENLGRNNAGLSLVLISSPDLAFPGLKTSDLYSHTNN
jgi:hypothetical protein